MTDHDDDDAQWRDATTFDAGCTVQIDASPNYDPARKFRWRLNKFDAWEYGSNRPERFDSNLKLAREMRLTKSPKFDTFRYSIGDGDRVTTSLGEGYVKIASDGAVTVTLTAPGFWQDGERNLADRDKRIESPHKRLVRLIEAATNTLPWLVSPPYVADAILAAGWREAPAEGSPEEAAAVLRCLKALVDWSEANEGLDEEEREAFIDPKMIEAMTVVLRAALKVSE